MARPVTSCGVCIDVSENTNPWIQQLLEWHGHDKGGVRVPFRSGSGRPLGRTITTPIIQRLRQLATDLADGVTGIPRWVFLVGGPGNGKSEAVESFIEALDERTGAGGRLRELVATKLRPGPMTSRRVTLDAQELGPIGGRFSKLILVQDASAVDLPAGQAEIQLIEDLIDLYKSPAGREPIFLCCANRGLLARALSATRSRSTLGGASPPQIERQIERLIDGILVATGLGSNALGEDRPRSWPLKLDSRCAAWPLDLETIVGRMGGERAPFEDVLEAAVDESRWDQNGRCLDCDSRSLCPFYANFKMLGEPDTRQRLLRLLRHGELATGQRWNFRDAFSLCAELLVGQHSDFVDDVFLHPCTWVHQRSERISHATADAEKFPGAWELAAHLFPQSLFPVWQVPESGLDFDLPSHAYVTKSVAEGISRRQPAGGALIQTILAGKFSNLLDPALESPPQDDSLLRRVEDEFGQSITQGLERTSKLLGPLERELLVLMAAAESEWIDATREIAKARRVLRWLRSTASTFVKRSLGVRHGEYLNAALLRDYEATLRDMSLLRTLVPQLRRVLAPATDAKFSDSLVRVLGQPTREPGKDILVMGPLGPALPHAAPRSSADRIGHDVPWIEIDQFRLAVTFDLFVALQLNGQGCDLASLQPHTRAAIDQMRNAVAARMSRDNLAMMGGTVSFRLGPLGDLTAGGAGGLEFQPESGT